MDGAEVDVTRCIVRAGRRRTGRPRKYSVRFKIWRRRDARARMRAQTRAWTELSRNRGFFLPNQLALHWHSRKPTSNRRRIGRANCGRTAETRLPLKESRRRSSPREPETPVGSTGRKASRRGAGVSDQGRAWPGAWRSRSGQAGAVAEAGGRAGARSSRPCEALRQGGHCPRPVA